MLERLLRHLPFIPATGSPTLRSQPHERRRILGRPVNASVGGHLTDEHLGRLICLSGKLELVGPSRASSGLPEDALSVSVVDESGLRLRWRSSGPVLLHCRLEGGVGETVELEGDIAVVVGSREDALLWDEHMLRMLVSGDVVRARGMLRRRARPPKGGYRGPAHRYVLERFRGFGTIDIAYEGRPRGMSTRVARALDAWATPLLAGEA